MTTTLTAPTTAHGIKVGQFFYTSWGWDQTNIDFYKVVGVTAKGVKIQKWQINHVEGGHFTQDAVVPDGGPVRGGWVTRDGVSTYDYNIPAPIRQKLVQTYAGTVTLRIASYANAYLWDGKTKYQTAAGYGH